MSLNNFGQTHNSKFPKKHFMGTTIMSNKKLIAVEVVWL